MDYTRITKQSNLRSRFIKDFLFSAALILSVIALIVPLSFILIYIIKNGIRVINWTFLFSLPKPVGEIGGGVSNAIVGSLMLIGMACLMSIPLGIGVGVALSEFKDNKWMEPIRVSIEVLQSIPSIVLGIIVYLWVVVPMGGFSAFSGGVALGLMMLPVVIRSTEETVKLLPETLKEAALSLGVPYYKTVLKVIIPSSFHGIITGILLGVARISGETAPLLFTAFGNPFMGLNIAKPVNALPLLIYNYATSPYLEWQSLAWGASFLLVIFVLSTSLIAKVVIKK